MKQAVQNSLNKQDRRNRRQDKSEKKSREPIERQEEKTSLSQLITAAERFAEGQTGKHTVGVASHFGNQTMLGLLEKGRSLKNGIASAAGILSGEAPPDFSPNNSNNAPSAEIEAGSAFSPSAPPDFSSSAPTVDIQTVGAAGL